MSLPLEARSRLKACPTCSLRILTLYHISLLSLSTKQAGSGKKACMTHAHVYLTSHCRGRENGTRQQRGHSVCMCVYKCVRVHV